MPILTRFLDLLCCILSELIAYGTEDATSKLILFSKTFLCSAEYWGSHGPSSGSTGPVEACCKCLDNKGIMRMALMDLSKAYDC